MRPSDLSFSGAPLDERLLPTLRCTLLLASDRRACERLVDNAVVDRLVALLALLADQQGAAGADVERELALVMRAVSQVRLDRSFTL